MDRLCCPYEVLAVNWRSAMKNSLKKALSLFLCLIMCFSLLPVSAFAEDDEVTEEPCPHTETVDVVTAPTCTEQGYTTHTCSACGASYRDSFVAATGHVEMAVDAVEPTYEAPGCTAGTKCSVCGTILSGCEKIDQLVAEEPEIEPEDEPELTKGLPDGAKGEPDGEPLRGVEENTSAILALSLNGSTFDYADRVTAYASVTGPDGTAASLDSQWESTPVTFTLKDLNDEAVTGFAVQSGSGFTAQVQFPLSDDDLAEGSYKIVAKKEYDGAVLRAEQQFYYTAVKENTPDLSGCSLDLTVLPNAVELGDTLYIQVFVTDASENPVEGVKVWFTVTGEDGSPVSAWLDDYDSLFNTTGEDGKCGLEVGLEEEGVPSGTYHVSAFIDDHTDICDSEDFTYTAPETGTDKEGPVITYITLPENGMTVSAGTVIDIAVRVEDGSGISSVLSALTYSDDNGVYYNLYADIILADEDGDGIYTGSYTFSADAPDGLYRLENIHAADTLYNYTNVFPGVILKKNVSGYYLVTLNFNGGYLGDESQTFYSDMYAEGAWFYGAWQLGNTDLHKALSGWSYLDADGNECFLGCYEEIQILRDMTFTAVWSDGYLVTFDANEGHFWDDSTTKTLAVVKGNSFPARYYSIESGDADKTFSGWYREAGCINRVCGPNGSYTPTEDIKLYAGWGTSVHITLNGNGGYFWEGKTSYTYDAPEGDLFRGDTDIPSNDDPSMAFTGWNYYDAESNLCFLAVDDSVAVNSDMTFTAVWEEITGEPEEICNVTLDFKGGLCSILGPNEQSISYSIIKGEQFYGLDWISSNLYHPEGKVLTGWYSNPDCTEYAYGNSDSFTVTEDMTLYAGWRDDGTQKVTVTFDANGGFLNGVEGQTQLVYKIQPGEPVYKSVWVGIVDDHKAFAEWNTSADGSGTAVEDPYWYSPETDTTLYAIWGKAFAITVHAGEGGHFSERPGVSVVTDKVLEGKTLGSLLVFQQLVNDDPQKAVRAWYLHEMFSGPEINVKTYIPTGDMELYPKWVSAFRLSFDANSECGGYFVDLNEQEDYYYDIVEQGSSFDTAQLEIFNASPRAQLTGWYSESGELICAAGGTITPTEDMYLKAGWLGTGHDEGGPEISDYSRNIEREITKGDTISFSVTVTSDVEIAEVWASLWRSHNYHVAGWSDAQVIQLENRGNGIWAVDYVLDGSELNGGYCVEYLIAKDVLGRESSYYEDDYYGFGISGCTEDADPPSLTAFTLTENGSDVRAGATIHFTAETSDEHGLNLVEGGILADILCSSSEDCSTYLFVDTVLMSKIAEGVFSGTFTFDTRRKAYGYDRNEELPNGYYFIAVCPEDNIGNQAYHIVDDKYVIFNEGVDAQHTITFDANGGYFNNDPDKLQIEVEVDRGQSISGYPWISVNNVGKAVAGWNTAADGSGETVDDLFSYEPVADVTLYAIWEEGCTVTLNANGGYFFGDTTILADTIQLGRPIFDAFTQYKRSMVDTQVEWNPMRRSVLFQGWYRTPECNGDMVDPETTLAEGDITLYAKWQDSWIVTYHANHENAFFKGDANIKTVSYAIAKGSSLAGVTQFNTGYPVYGPDMQHDYSDAALLGWYQNENCTGDPVDTSTFVPEGDLDLYAGWAEYCTVTFHSNGGRFEDGEEEYPYIMAIKDHGFSKNVLNAIAAKLTPPAEGMTLTGWMNEAGVLVCPVGGSFVPAGDMTLYAVWEATANAFLTLDLDGDTFDFADRVTAIAKVEPLDGNDESLDGEWENSYITFTLKYTDDEPVPGFLVQGSWGFNAEGEFPLADDDMLAGTYKIVAEKVYQGVVLRAEKEFYYTADKSALPDYDSCTLELSIESDSVWCDGQILWQAYVTDANGDPAKGVKVCFSLRDEEWNPVTTVLDGYDWIYNITDEDGRCALVCTILEEELTAGKYYAVAWIDGAEENMQAVKFTYFGRGSKLTFDANGGYFTNPDGYTDTLYYAIVEPGGSFDTSRLKLANTYSTAVFTGWYTTPDCDDWSYYGAGGSITPTDEDMVLYAGWSSMGPELISFTMEEDGKTLSAGDSVHVSADAFTDFEITRVYCELARTQADGRIAAFGFDLDENGGVWSGSIEIDESFADGVYYPYCLKLEDSNRNVTWLMAGQNDEGKLAGEFTLEGASTDNRGPVISDVVVSPASGSAVSAGETVSITATIKDEDDSEITAARAELFYCGSDGNSYGPPVDTIELIKGENDVWSGSYAFTEDDEDSLYVIYSLFAGDSHGNTTYYSLMTYLKKGCSEVFIVTVDPDGTNGGYIWTPGTTNYSYTAYEGDRFYPYGYDVGNTYPGKKLTGWNYTGSDGNEGFLSIDDYEGVIIDGDITFTAVWAEGFSVTFHANGGVFWNGADTITEAFTPTDTFSWPGVYHSNSRMAFTNWFLDPECTQPVVEFDDFVVGQAYDLYAGWSNGYTIIYAANGGDGSNYSITEVLGQYVWIYDNYWFGREGYKFAGWNTKANGKGTQYNEGTTAAPLAKKVGAKVTLYAQWIPNTYTVNFDCNGFNGESATGAMQPLQMTYGKTVALPANAFTNNGYNFLGWSTDPGSKTSVYTNKQKVSNLTADPDGEVTLYAIWTEISGRIVFNANGGTGVMENACCRVGTDYVLPAPGFTREGFDFIGWNTNANGKGKSYKAGDVYPIVNEKTVTLFANWQAHTYTITFDGNGATNATMPPLTCACGKTYTLTANKFKIDGYTFGGWLDDYGFLYTNKQKVSSLTTDHEGVVTLHALWIPVEYKITYKNVVDADGYPGPATYTAENAGEVAELLMHYTDTGYISRPGYSFDGWFTDSKCTKPVTEETFGKLAAKTLYAKWTQTTPEKVTYSITFYPDFSFHPDYENPVEGITGSTAPMANIVVGKTIALKANGYKRNGYTFDGWYRKDEDGNWYFYSNKQKVSFTGDVELYGSWTPIQYKITYKNICAADINSNPATYTLEDDLALVNPMRPGCVFGGWFLDSKFKNPVTEIPAGRTGAVTLYAKWDSKVTYTVHFDANGGTGTMKDLTKKVNGTVFKLTKNAFKRTGYTFVGWNTRPDGRGMLFTNEKNINTITAGNLATRDGEVVTLYAMWKPIEYTITYYNAEIDEEWQVVYITDDRIILPEPRKDGYEFLGWYTTSTFKAGTGITEIGPQKTGNISLYAKWQLAP